MAVYQDVLVVPVPQSARPDKMELEAIQRAEVEEDQRVVASLEVRLCDPSVDIQSQHPKLISECQALVRASVSFIIFIFLRC